MYLNSRLGETNACGEVLSHENVWVVSPSETPLKLIELSRCETSAMALLFDALAITGLSIFIIKRNSINLPVLCRGALAVYTTVLSAIC